MVAKLQYLRFCLFEMYVNVVFVIRCLYSAVSLTLFKEQRFTRIIIIIIISPSWFDKECLDKKKVTQSALRMYRKTSSEDMVLYCKLRKDLIVRENYWMCKLGHYLQGYEHKERLEHSTQRQIFKELERE